MLIQLVLPPMKNTVGLGDSKGDLITMSFTTPIILKLSGLRNRGFQCINSLIGFFRFINFAADSLMTKQEESLEKSLEKSRPSINCQPTVLPYSGVTLNVANSGLNPGSLSFQSKPPLLDQISVAGPVDSATSSIKPVFFSSLLSTSVFP